MSLIYEINISIDSAIKNEFNSWLVGHMIEVNKMGCFEGYERYHLKDNNCEIIIHYFAKDLAMLNNYLENQAPLLREEAIRKFGDKFKAVRRILCQNYHFGVFFYSHFVLIVM